MPFNNDECYCVICDLYFSSQAQRMEHIQESPDHPGCDYCQRRFLNKNILRNHFVYSRHHHYCASCEIEFQTPAGLRYHIEHAPVHCDDSDSEEDEEDDGEEYSSIPEHEWEEEMGRLRYPDEQAPEEDDSDDSWEDFDDYDYESAEELKVPQGVKDEDEDTDDEDDDDENVVPHFSCPMCEKNSESVTCAPCGHLFCSPCIANAIKQTSVCPICAEPALVPQLRKIFLA
ncbi:putative zinc-finger-containing protein [Mycena galericulata]|nr:putative zinc-finger-containing protein [Mycena galericulata]